MAFLTNTTILLILACVSHQLVLSSCQKTNGRKTRGMDRDRTGLRAGRQTKSNSLQPIEGKTVTRDKAECTWAATGSKLLTMGVTCKKGSNRISCEFVARPGVCKPYTTNVKLYWKQIARALRKQKDLCQDNNALVKAGMCRKAPREAHFRFRKTERKASPRLSLTPVPLAVKSCQRANKKLAEEYCSHSWSSVCTFFFTMVKDYDC